jgi:Kdo2-lipid IVA lauroyltransferase/acyltransferase
LHGPGWLGKAFGVPREFKKNHPKFWKWRLEWLVQTGLEKVAGLLPGPLVFRLGEILGGIAYHLMTSRRQIVLRNLRIAFYQQKELPELEQMARETFRRTGANLFSALHTTRLTAKQASEIVEVENPELIHQALSQHPGMVLMPSHMGNWEILTRIHRELPPGHENGAFYRPLNNPLLDARVLAQREAEGCRLFSKRDSFHQATGFLRGGGILGILADQRAGPQGELVRFFGRLTRASPLPGLLARRSKSGVLAMSLVTVSPGKWLCRYHPLVGPISTASCMAAIEQAILASPLDYFWLQERWKVFLRPDRTIRDWLGPDTLGEGTPHRALLLLPAGRKLPEEWAHPDVDYLILPSRATPPSNTAGLVKFLCLLDILHALPLDYILTCNASPALVKAARRLSIPLISLP